MQVISTLRIRLLLNISNDVARISEKPNLLNKPIAALRDIESLDQRRLNKLDLDSTRCTTTTIIDHRSSPQST